VNVLRQTFLCRKTPSKKNGFSFPSFYQRWLNHLLFGFVAFTLSTIALAPFDLFLINDVNADFCTKLDRIRMRMLPFLACGGGTELLVTALPTSFLSHERKGARMDTRKG
jgi:hypothetical protein